MEEISIKINEMQSERNYLISYIDDLNRQLKEIDEECQETNKRYDRYIYSNSITEIERAEFYSKKNEANGRYEDYYETISENIKKINNQIEELGYKIRKMSLEMEK